MIVSLAQATEAAELLGIGDDPDWTKETITGAYRRAARTTHPDGGGAMESFAAVDRAKHVMLAWLERQPDGVAKALTADLCPVCEGTGAVKVRRGFTAPLRMQCGRCKGTGDLNYEHDVGGE